MRNENRKVFLGLRIAGIDLRQLAADRQAILKVLQRGVRLAQAKHRITQPIQRDGNVALRLGVAGVGRGQFPADRQALLIVLLRGVRLALSQGYVGQIVQRDRHVALRWTSLGPASASFLRIARQSR